MNLDFWCFVVVVVVFFFSDFLLYSQSLILLVADKNTYLSLSLYPSLSLFLMCVCVCYFFSSFFSLNLCSSGPQSRLANGSGHMSDFGFLVISPPTLWTCIKWRTLSLIQPAVSARRGRRHPDRVGMRGPDEGLTALLCQLNQQHWGQD